MGGEKAAAAVPLTKNQRRRLKKKAEKKKAALTGGSDALQVKDEPAKTLDAPVNGSATDASDVEVEYVSMDMSKELSLPEDDPAYEEFMRILGKFSSAEQLCGQTSDEEVGSVAFIRRSNWQHTLSAHTRLIICTGRGRSG